MAPHCMEHEQFEIVLVTDKMLAEAKKREEVPAIAHALETKLISFPHDSSAKAL